MNSNLAPVNTSVKINNKERLFYAMPMISMVSFYAPMNIVQGIYAKYYGLTLTSLATAILFIRILDVFTDPLVGYLSDRSQLKYGSRKPNMVTGGLILIVSGYLLYSPPDGVSISYFVVCATGLFLGMTILGIPHMAWGGEIAHNAHEKTQIYSLRTSAGYAGLALFYSLPLLPFWDSTEITPETLHWAGIVSSVLMLPLLYLCLVYVPNGRCLNRKSLEAYETLVSNRQRFCAFKKIASDIFQNKPLMIFLGAFVFNGLALGSWLGLLFIYVDTYLGMGAIFSEIFLISLFIGVVATQAWAQISKYIGKRWAWFTAMLIGMGSFVYTGLLSPENASYNSLLILLIINTLCFVCVESLPQSMLSDIIDYTTLKFGLYRGSTYFSLYMFTYKGAFAFGGALGLAIAGHYNFDPSATLHTKQSIDGLKLGVTWMPVVLGAIALVFIGLMPINARRHSLICRRINRLSPQSS